MVRMRKTEDQWVFVDVVGQYPLVLVGMLAMVGNLALNENYFAALF
jgi:hypothetical protein